MTIQTTIWTYPCGCIVDYDWEDTDSTIPHTYKQHRNTCAIHNAVVTSNKAKWDSCVEEQQRINFSLRSLLDNSPSTVYDMNGTVRVLKETLTYNWSWTGTAPNRVLTITLVGVSLTNAQRNTIQNALNTRFGAGKVTLG